MFTSSEPRFRNRYWNKFAVHYEIVRCPDFKYLLAYIFQEVEHEARGISGQSLRVRLRGQGILSTHARAHTEMDSYRGAMSKDNTVYKLNISPQKFCWSFRDFALFLFWKGHQITQPCNEMNFDLLLFFLINLNCTVFGYTLLKYIW